MFIVVRGPVPRNIGWFRFHRSAGACPPQCFGCLKQDGQDLSGFLGWDRPSPSGAFIFIVVRGPVPRNRGVARDRPSPYGYDG